MSTKSICINEAPKIRIHQPYEMPEKLQCIDVGLGSCMEQWGMKLWRDACSERYSSNVLLYRSNLIGRYVWETEILHRGEILQILVILLSLEEVCRADYE